MLSKVKLPVFLVIFITFINLNSIAQTFPSGSSDLPPFVNPSKQWVDSVFKTLSPEDKIAQLMMIRVLSNKNQRYEDSISTALKKYRVGGLIFFQGGPVRQATLTNKYQAEAKVPYLIAIDGEWGLGMRLDSTISFPYQMTLGAVQDDSLIYRMGVAVAKHCKRMGIHINFAPVVDVNNNPNNPVISYRSFGENKEKVALKSYMYMKGMQDNGVLATAKHFPGHGDTDVDSHLGLPLINFDRSRLDSLELYPFKYLIERGLGGVMVAHLSIPKLDSTKNQPSTLSKPIITGLLKKELDFKGLIFTDALDMKGVTKYYGPGDLDVKAVVAGNDVLELSENIPVAIKAIREAIGSGKINQADIDSRCRKILEAKFWAGLNNYQPIQVKNLVEDLNDPYSQLLNRQLTEASLTVLKNDQNILPLRKLDSLKVLAIALNTVQPTAFQQMLQNYLPVEQVLLPSKPAVTAVEEIRKKMTAADLVILSIHQFGRPRNIQLDPVAISVINDVNNSGKGIVALFTNAYSVNISNSFPSAKGIVMAYQDSPVSEELAAQLIFGAVGCNGKLPVTSNEIFKYNTGLDLNGLNRLKYTLPEEVGMDSKKLLSIDSLVAVAIKQKAIPGCEIIATRDGKVIYNKSFGYHTYDNKRKVLNSDLYDLASVTKVTASLAALMKLYGEGKFNPDAKLSQYLPEFKGSNKGDLNFREILTHQARLKAWIPFWENTLKKKYRTGKMKGDDNRKFKWSTFKSDSSKRFPFKVADNLYLHKKYYKKVYKQIKKSPLNDKPGYVYSDLSFYLYPIIVERITGKKFENYLKEEIYKPIGATTLTFNPYLYYDKDRIVPTEFDSLFRKVLIQGRVHDEGAAMLNGLSGHAGLFGTANDLAKMMQLYLNKGKYGGRTFIKEFAIDEFTRCQFCPTNRRALGFDRPQDPPSASGNAALSASPISFGHTGFTGIFTWVDPKYNLVYVFLSNRVYPTRNNSTLFKLNTRTNIQQVLYDAIIKK